MAIPELTKTWAVEDCVVLVNGVPISGMSAGVKAKRASDAFNKKIGVDGTAARGKNPDRSGEIEITCLGTSKSNDFLNSLALIDELTGFGTAIVTIKDLRGSTTLVGAQSWIKKLPDLDLGVEVPDKRWLFDCSQLKGIWGGNV